MKILFNAVGTRGDFDQFLWNPLSHENGLGPYGIKIGTISEKNLAPKIIDLYHEPSYKPNALVLSKKMEKEDFTATLVGEIMD